MALQVENPTDETLNAPNVRIVCANQPNDGEYYASSTFDVTGEISAGGARQADVHLAFPEGENGVAFDNCVEPVLRVWATVSVRFASSEEIIVDYYVP